MSIQEILAELPRLTPAERQALIRRAQALDEERPWTPEELTAAARKMVAEGDSTKAQALREEIVKGFYGRGEDA